MRQPTNPTKKTGPAFPVRRALLGLLAALTLAVPARAARTVPVQIDGTALDAAGHLEDGVTYVPLRALLNALGGWEVAWDADLRAAVAVSGSSRLTADPAADAVTVDGETRPGKVYVREGVTYVPLRATAELLGGTVEWDRYFQGAAVTSPDAAHNAVDFYWLSRIISAESRGEPMEGQIAVGNVVLERVESPDFPDTIPDVVFQVADGFTQFEPVENGTVYLEPTEQSVEAARRALEGEKSLEGAMFFYAPALSEGVWINSSRTYLTTIGCHRFYL